MVVGPPATLLPFDEACLREDPKVVMRFDPCCPDCPDCPDCPPGCC